MLQQRLPDSSRQPTVAHRSASGGFAQIFGLHPAVAFLTFIVDAMLFGEEGLATVMGLPTGGTSLVASLMISCCGGAFVGMIAYLAQMKWYGDDRESARIKALILGFLTAVPTALPAFIYVPAGIVGLFRRKTDT